MGPWDATSPRPGAGTYVLASWLFLRVLGVIYFAAFTSLAGQIRGLAGRDGILPVAEFLNGRRHWGWARFWRWPSLCWFSSSDTSLLCLCWGGAILAVLLVVGVVPVAVLFLLWLSYLSLFTACRLFLCYQWDILLLETGFLAIFLAPVQILPEFPPRSAPPAIAVWLLWWLLFRLMFWSGAVKLRSGDRTWRNFTALNFHYESQPLPTPVAWYAQRCPRVFHKWSVGVVLAIELLAPFWIPAPSAWRYAAAWLFILLMVLIELTGNYAFFNWLGIALSLLLFDDKIWLRVFKYFSHVSEARIMPASSISVCIAAGVALVVALLSLDIIGRLFRVEISRSKSLSGFFDVLEPLRLVNSYGLFAVMTTGRPEIILEGSEDGINWREYEFKWKPGDVRRAPRFVAPHQPRLDWQMWFAALGAPLSNLWLERLRSRLLQGSPAVLSLLKTNPFPQQPPAYVRAVLYHYRFARTAERRATGAWWVRERRGLCPTMS